MTPTPRASRVLLRAQSLPVTVEWIGPTIRINMKTMTVAEAEAWVDGFEFGWRKPRRLVPLERGEDVVVGELREVRGADRA